METTWRYCVECPQYSIWIEALGPPTKFRLAFQLSLPCRSCPKSASPTNTVLRVLQISSESIHFWRSYNQMREHCQNVPFSESKPSFEPNKNNEKRTESKENNWAQKMQSEIIIKIDIVESNVIIITFCHLCTIILCELCIMLSTASCNMVYIKFLS